jgi:leader peptidase (prepilin peptidase)/N-methyltransferase
VSFLSLGGRCRYCRHRIDDTPIAEILTVLLFVLSYAYWPLPLHGAGLLEFVCWLIFVTGFMGLAIYDLKWFLLPNRVVYPLLALAVVQVLTVALFFSGGTNLLLGSLWGLLVGGGFFYLLFQLSGGKWIGGGDVKLGAVLGIIVGGPLNACLVLFGASLIGTVITLPLIITGRAKRTTVIPFGPFLLVATIVVRIFGASIVMWLRQRAYLPAN